MPVKDLKDWGEEERGEKMEFNLDADTQSIVERLQKKWLLRMEYLFDRGLISSTDMATLERFLSRNGWTVDPTKLPEKLRDKLIDHVSFDDDEEGDGSVIPIRRKA